MTVLDESIQRILRQAAAWTNEINGPSSWAVGQLMTLFEITNRPDYSTQMLDNTTGTFSTMREYYEDVLPLEVRMAPFGEEEQQVATDDLCRLAAEPPATDARGSYLNILCNSLPWVAFEPIAELLVQRPGPVWADEDICEALVVIQHMLDYVGMDEGAPDYPKLQSVLAVVERLHLDEMMSELARDNNERIATVAESNLRPIACLRDRFRPENMWKVRDPEDL